MIHHGNCVVHMGVMEPLSVDHILCDPPYDEHTHTAQRQGCTGYTEPTRPGATKAQFNRSRELGFDYLSAELRQVCARHFARIVRRWVLIFSDHEGSVLWGRDLRNAGLEVVRYGIWEKLGATPQFTGDRPAQGHEVIVIAHPPPPYKTTPKKRWNGGGRHALWRVPIVLNRGERGEQRVHTTQKPLALMEALVRDFTDEGDTILDPFAGSGTTLVAAERNGREGFGYELDAEYAEVARRRLEATHEQRSLPFS